MSRHLIRGSLLLSQKKFEQAEEVLRGALAEDPHDPMGHALLAHCLTAREKLDEAEREAQQAIHLGPDVWSSHYALANVLFERHRISEARRAIDEAIRLDPADARGFAMLAAIHLECRDWQATVDAADEGLRADPEHIGCTNVRAIALRQLGHDEAADATVTSLLGRAPDDAMAHANRGWALLSSGDHRAAMESFREALRLDPELEWARMGLINAMKARNIIYRMVLHFFLWMSRLSRQAQWGIIIGLYIGFRLVRGVAQANPELAPITLPLIIAYVIFAYLTWTAVPFFNLILRLDRVGRYVLKPSEILAANCVGMCILVGIAGVAWTLYTGDFLGLILAGMCLVLVIPISAAFAAEPGWPRQAMTAYVAAMIAIAVAILIGDKVAPDANFMGSLISLFLLGAILSSWVGNALAMARPTR